MVLKISVERVVSFFRPIQSLQAPKSRLASGPQLIDARSRFTSVTRNFSSAAVLPGQLHPPVDREWNCLLYPEMNVSVCEWGPRHSSRNVLLLHGWMDSAASFYRLAPILSKRMPSARFVAIDLPGHGKSSHRPPGSFYYFTDYIGDVHAFVTNHLKWTHFDVIGHSMGGNVGMLLSASFPELVQKLAMIDIIGPMPTIPAAMAAPQLRKGVLERSLALEHIQKGPKLYPSLEDAINRLANSEWSSSMKRESIQILAERQVRKVVTTDSLTGDVKEGYAFNHDPKLRAAAPARLSEEQVYAYAAAIKCPVYVLATLAYNKFVQHDKNWVEKRKAAFPSLVVENMKGGHHPHLDEPVVVAENILRFFGEPDGAGFSEASQKKGDENIPRLE